MAFIAKIAFILCEAVAGIFTSKDCKTCESAPWGYTFDVEKVSSCDDCLRRRLVFDRVTYNAVWGEFMKGNSEAIRIVDLICDKNRLYMSQELSCGFVKNSLTSRFLFPSNDVNSASYVSFLKHVRAQKELFVEEQKAPDLTKESDEVAFSFGVRSNVFLTENRFLELAPGLCDRGFAGFAALDKTNLPYFCEGLVQSVDVFVPIGREDTGHGLAKGAHAIISNSTVPLLIKDGKLATVGAYQRLAEMVIDPSCGVTRRKKLDGVFLKREYLPEPEVYFNLAFTAMIHCNLAPLKDKRLVKGSCMVHRVGQLSDCDDAVYHPNWVPLSYGVKMPQGVLTAEKPILTGITASLLQANKLASSVATYLTSKARLIAPSFSTLHASVQSFLLAKFKDAASIPANLIARVVGKTVEEAANIIFSKSEAVIKPPPVDGKKNSNPTPAPAAAAKVNPKPKVSKVVPFAKSFSAKQIKVLTASFGGGFDCFLKLQKEHHLGGKLDLMKLTNYFKDGKPNFGKLTNLEISAKCAA